MTSPYRQIIGDGSTKVHTLPHGLGTRDVEVLVRQIGSPFEIYQIFRATADDPNTVVLHLDRVLAVGQAVASVAVVSQSDVTAPTAPTAATVGTITHTTIPVTVTGGGTDADSGVLGYYFFNNGVYVGASGTGVFTYTGLTAATDYSGLLTVVTVDNELNESAPYTIPGSLLTPAVLSANIIATSTQGSNSTAANPITSSCTLVVPSGSTNVTILAAAVVTHNGWTDPNSAYSPESVTSSIDGALTRVGPAASLGAGGQQQGGVLLFEVPAASAGTHTIGISEHNTTFQNFDGIKIIAIAVENVDSLGTPVRQSTAAANGALSLSVPSTKPQDLVVAVAGFSNAPSGLNQTLIAAVAGGAIAGTGDYQAFMEAAGLAGSVSFTSTSTGHEVGAVGINIKAVP